MQGFWLFGKHEKLQIRLEKNRKSQEQNVARKWHLKNARIALYQSQELETLSADLPSLMRGLREVHTLLTSVRD